MQCYYHELFREYQFDKAGYQQFLREQGLSEYDIKHLNIHLITDFTRAHFKGCVDLAPDGAFFQREKEYIEGENRKTAGFYRPYDPPNKYAAIFLRPAIVPNNLNRLFLHETRHHIQHCLKLPCSAIDAEADYEAHRARSQPWEVDADNFADDYVNQVSFFVPIPFQWRKSDLQKIGLI